MVIINQRHHCEIVLILGGRGACVQSGRMEELGLIEQERREIDKGGILYR